MKLVSIVMPAYNASNTINKSITSVLKQSHKNFELIIINDGSKDNTKEIINSFIENDKRIRYFEIINSGSAVARNVGLDNCKGDYIAFLDADDQYDVNFLSGLLYFSEKYNTDITSCSFQYFKHNRVHEEKTHIQEGLYDEVDLANIIYPSLLSTDDLSDRIPTTMWTKLYRRSLIENNNIRFVPELKMSQDKIFSIKCFLYAKSFYYLPTEKWYYYYYNKESRTNTYLKNSWMIMKNNYYQLYDLNKKSFYQLDNQLPYVLLRNSMTSIVNATKSNLGITEKINEIKSIINDNDLIENIKYINLNNLKINRKVISYLIKYKRAYLLFILSELYNKFYR